MQLGEPTLFSDLSFFRPPCMSLDCMYKNIVSAMTHQLRVADGEVPLDGQHDVGEDGAAQDHVVDRVQRVHEQLKRKA